MLMLTSLLIAVVSASHLRYGTITWEKGNGNHVKFTIETAWRRSYDGNYKTHHKGQNGYLKSTGTGNDQYPVTGDVIEINGLEWPVFQTGDGTMSYLTLTVTAYSQAEDWFYGVTTIDHTYSTPSKLGNPWVASFTGCCRLSNLENNKDRTWNLQSHVNLLLEEYAPHVKSLPIISVPENENVEFHIPAANPNHEKALGWALATSTELGGTKTNPATQPPTLAIDDKGKCTMDTKHQSYTTPFTHPANQKSALFNAGIMIISGAAKAPVDFLIRVLETNNGEGSSVESIPSIESITPKGELTEYVGHKVTITLTATDKTATDRVGFTWGVLPDGAVLSTVKGVNNVEQTFSWTPCNTQQGQHIVCYEAVDQKGTASVQQCTVINVHTDPAPRFNGPNYPGHNVPTAYIGQELTFDVLSDDENCKDQVTIAMSGSKLNCESKKDSWPAGAELLPQEVSNFPDVCNQRKRVFSWTPKWDQGGWKGQVCVKTQDLAGGCKGAGVVQTTEMCLNMYVHRCKYAVQYEQQLQEVSAIYATDWINTWQHNPDIPHPDFVLYANQVINIGHVYKVNIRDNLHDIATRFGTSVQWLHYLNMDLCADHTVDIDQEICVISNSCEGMILSPYGKAGAKDNYWYSSAKDAYKRHGGHETAGTQHTYAPGHK